MSTFRTNLLVSNSIDLFSPVKQTKALWRNGPIFSLRQEIYKMSLEQHIVPERKKMLQNNPVMMGLCHKHRSQMKELPVTKAKKIVNNKIKSRWIINPKYVINIREFSGINK